MSGRPALLAILQQPEFFRLVNDFSTWHRPPVSANTAAVGVLEGLGQASLAVHEAAAAGSRGYPDRLAGRPALLAILQQPELFHIVNSFATWYRPPVSTNTAAVWVLAELGQTSVAVHEAAATGARGYPNLTPAPPCSSVGSSFPTACGPTRGTPYWLSRLPSLRTRTTSAPHRELW